MGFFLLYSSLFPSFLSAKYPSNNLLFSFTRSFTSSSHHALPFFFLPTHLYPQTITAHLTTVLLNFSHSASTSRTLLSFTFSHSLTISLWNASLTSTFANSLTFTTL